MQELQNTRKIAEVKVVKKQELWGLGFDVKLQLIINGLVIIVNTDSIFMNNFKPKKTSRNYLFKFYYRINLPLLNFLNN